MNKKFLNAICGLCKDLVAQYENKIAEGEKNGLTAEDIATLKERVARINEFVASLQESTEGDDIETIYKKIIAEITKRNDEVLNECTKIVENAFKFYNIAKEGKTDTPHVKEFAKLYENQIKALQTQLGVQVFKNALTITPAGSLPTPAGVALAEPAFILPKIFDYATEAVDGILQGSFSGAKLRVLKVTQSGNVASAVAEGANKAITDVTMSATDVSPLKVAVVIENVTVEQIEFNEWLEATLKIYATKLLFNNLESAAVAVLSANSVAYDGTSAANTVAVPYLENIAVAGASQLAKANYFGKKVAFVNEADWLNNLNAQDADATPVENAKIGEHITFVPSGAVPAGTMYVADVRYLKKKMYKDVFVERATSHTHNGDGLRLYPNATDYIFDVLAYFFVEDSSAVVKLDIATVSGVIKKA